MSRIRTKDAAELLGVAPRTVQSMVARGMLPGAAKIGGVLTFDRAKLDRYLEGEEARCLRNSCSSVARRGYFESSLPASKSEKAYQLAMSRLLGKDGTSAS